MQLNFRNTAHLHTELLVDLLCAHVVPKHPKNVVAMRTCKLLLYARCDFMYHNAIGWMRRHPWTIARGMSWCLGRNPVL